MSDKRELLSKLSWDWQNHWKIEYLVKLGFKRYHCQNCGKHFWSQQEQKTCNDSSCRPYDFIGKPIGKKMSYSKVWDEIQKFFKKEGHTPLQRYPTVCRWYPLYFTIAGIVDFYRMDAKKLTFEFPANPSILTQPCLRFNDIPQVGVSGRHFTCFNMIQQSSLYDGKKGYWKERAIELDHQLLTKVFKIPSHEINFIEDVWMGYGAFGYSMEYHVKGLELGNAVFTEFEGTLGNYRKMKNRIVDMGAGQERFAWLVNGTPTNYDVVFGDVIESMKKKGGVKYDKDLFLKYAKLAGVLNLDDVPDLNVVRNQIAQKLSVSVEDLKKNVEPMQAVYAIADHAKALSFAIADGGLPSNIGGGYNLRVILRRALGFIDKYELPFDLIWVSEQIAKDSKKHYPELKKNLPQIREILEVEEKRYRSSVAKTRKLVNSIFEKKEKLDEKKIIELYDSHGIMPEMLTEVAEKNKMHVTIPSDLYAKVTEKHIQEKQDKSKERVDVEELPETCKLYYDDMKKHDFKAKVVKIFDNKLVVLDQTAFYPRGGGQEPDHGMLGKSKVNNVERLGNVVIHTVDKPDFNVNDTVSGKVDPDRRKQITIHHDATHIISGVVRKYLGKWAWQQGTKKDVDKAHIDIDHYEVLTPKQVSDIEKMANNVVKKKMKIIKTEMNRTEAEKKYGFGIYQGAAIPMTKLRIVNIGNFDIEACGGTHGDNTSELGKIIITRVERPADGRVRLFYKAGPAAEKYLDDMEKIVKDSSKLLKSKPSSLPKAAKLLLNKWKSKKKEHDDILKKFAEKQSDKFEFEIRSGVRYLFKEIPGAGPEQLREISRQMSIKDSVIFLVGTSDRIHVFGSAGEEAAKKVNMGKMVSEFCRKIGGKGGGTPTLAQGSAPKTDVKNNLYELRKAYVR